MKILYKYLTKEISQVFLFFVASFFFVFVLIDYSIHARLFYQEQIPFGKMATYYLWQFSEKMEILFPLALLLTLIKILTTMNVRLELVAIQASGIAFKRFFRPFLYFACLITLFLYVNQEWFQPNSLFQLKNFEKSELKKLSPDLSSIYSLNLNDALLLYQHYNEKEKTFKNVFLVNNFDEIFRMELIEMKTHEMVGKNGDYLLRNKATHAIEKKESFETKTFPLLDVDEKQLLQINVPIQAQSLSQLQKKISSQKLFSPFHKMSDKEAENISSFSYKLFMPLLPILVTLFPLYFCVQYTRRLPIFLLFAVSLFAFFVLFIVINSCLILSKHQVVPPFLSFFVLFSTLFSLVGYRYAKL